MGALDQLQVWFTTQLPNIVQALLILFVGWIIALILSAVVRSVLRRLRADERLNRQVELRGKVTVSIPSLNGIRIATQPLGDNHKWTRLRGLIVVAL